MNTIGKTLACLAGLIALGVCSSCSQQTQAPVAPVVPPKPDNYEIFVRSHPNYPKIMAIYRDRELMQQATPLSPIYICLSEQRGRLYVNGRVAADWPVSTGTAGHPTPTGTFRVLEKKREYSSRTWGRMLDANGRCVDANAHSSNTPVPEGGRFVGSPMPNWQRLTGNGIGMHTGKVRAGRRLSHGCIRTPDLMARELFDITATGRTRVTVCDERESCYPTFVGTGPITNGNNLTAAPAAPAVSAAQQQPTPEAQQAAPAAPAVSAAQQQPTPEAQQAAPAAPAVSTAQQQPTPEAQQAAPTAPAVSAAQQQPAPEAQQAANSAASSTPIPVSSLSSQLQPLPAAE